MKLDFLILKQIDDKPLPNDFQLSLDRLNSLYSRLEKDPEILAEYTRIIDEQVKLGIVEYVPEQEQTHEFIEQNNVHFLPHFAVIRKDRETTRLRIVFDGSAKTTDRDYSFSDYLETGPNSLPQLFDVLTSFRSNLIAFTSDVEKAFLQVSVKADDRDTLRFFWYETDSNGELKLLQLRFNRFGLTPSPAILGGVVQHHSEKYEQSEPEVIDQLRRQIYVDDFPGGSDTIENAFQLGKKSKENMKAGGMNLPKFKSNSKQLIERLNSEGITDNVESLNCETSSENSESKLPKNETLEDDTSYVKTTVGPQQTSENSSATKVL